MVWPATNLPNRLIADVGVGNSLTADSRRNSQKSQHFRKSKVPLDP